VHAVVWGSFAARLPALKHGLGIDDGQLGLALFGMAIFTVAGTRIAPPVIDRLGSRGPIRVGTVLLCVALLGPALASSYAVFCAVLPVLGVVGGFLDVAFNAQGIAVQRAYGRPILAGLHGAWSLGLFAGGAIGAAAAALGVSPTAQFAVVGAGLAVASAPLLAWQLPREAEPAHPHDTGRRPPLLEPQVLALGAIGFAAFMAEGAAADWSAIYARDRLASGAGLAGAAFTAFGVAMAVARLGGDRVIARVGPTRVVRAGGALAAVGFVLVVAPAEIAAALAGFVLVGLGLSTVVPIAFGAAGETTLGSTGAVLGRVVTLSYVGSIVGPAAIGVAADHLGLRAALLIPLALAVGISLGAGAVRTR
jgi:predicted MFS family arabinose efflux permease